VIDFHFHLHPRQVNISRYQISITRFVKSQYNKKGAMLQVLLDSEFPYARPPTKGSTGAAGYDVYSCEDSVIPSRGRKIVGFTLVSETTK
jgi:hypothetical protein